eukprot:5420259-Pyramimonas_sp.AAC.1
MSRFGHAIGVLALGRWRVQHGWSDSLPIYPFLRNPVFASDISSHWRRWVHADSFWCSLRWAQDKIPPCLQVSRGTREFEIIN